VKIVIDKDVIRIELSRLERMLTFHRSFKVPISQIREISTDLPPPTWKEIRAPGTAILGLTKAGTYYTNLFLDERLKKKTRIRLSDSMYPLYKGGHLVKLLWILQPSNM
jgi:hypothetical protein